MASVIFVLSLVAELLSMANDIGESSTASRFRWSVPKLIHMFSLLRDEMLGELEICPLLAKHGDKEGAWENFLDRLRLANAPLWEGAVSRALKDRVHDSLKLRCKADRSHSFLSGSTEEFSTVEKLLTEITQVRIDRDRR